ncbi:MAG: hypothetical protein R3B07_00495 [Polyangiaceae bacterium]
MHRTIAFIVFALLATGSIAGCGGESEGDPLPQPGDDWYPAQAQFSVGTGAPGNREVTIRWGTSVARCGTPDVDGCAYDSASITLNEAELKTGASSIFRNPLPSP